MYLVKVLPEMIMVIKFLHHSLYRNLYLRKNYKESNIEEDTDLKDRCRIKNLTDPISIREASSKNYSNSFFNDPNRIKNTTHVDFNDKNLDNVRFIKVNSFPALEEQLTPKYYVENAITDGVDEKSLLRLDPDEEFKLGEQDSIVLNTTLTLPKTIIELPTKNYVNKKYIDPSVTKNTAHLDFNDKNLDINRFVKVNSMPAVREHITPKQYVDQAIFYIVYELSLLRLDPDEKINLDEQDSIFLKPILTTPKTIREIPTESYVGSLHENSRNRRDLPSVFSDRVNEFDFNKLTNLDSVTNNRNPSSNNDISKKNLLTTQ